MASNFTFLDSHRTVRTKTSQLGRLTVPAATTSGVDDDEDARSVTSSQAPGQVATSSQASQPPTQPPHDSRSPRAGTGVRRVDDAILSLVDRMSVNTAVQDRLLTAEQEASRPRIAFCQWMGLEVAKLDETLWNDFTDEAYALVSKYKRLQMQSAAPPHQPPPGSQPPMPPQPMLPQPPPVRPLSAPPQPAVYRQQQPWQASPGTSTDYQHPGWGPYAPNLSGFNTSRLSTYLDPTYTAPVHASSSLSTPDLQRPGSRASSLGERAAATSDFVRQAHNALEDDEDSPPKL